MAWPRRGLNVLISLAVVGATLVLAPLTLVGMGIAAVSAGSMEVLWPLRARRRSRAALITDLTHAVGNRYLVLLLVIGALKYLSAISRIMPAAVIHFVHSLPGLAQLAIIFVLGDLFAYIGHLMLHRVPLLWRFHAVHHSSEYLDWLATSRVHPVDLGFNLTVISLPYVALGYGGSPSWLIAIYFLHPFYLHVNARLPLRVLEPVLVTPLIHHWHHTDQEEAYDKNFGSVLSVWDWIFRTARVPGEYPDRYGVSDPGLDTAGYFGHLLAPLIPRSSRPMTMAVSADEMPVSAGEMPVSAGESAVSAGESAPWRATGTVSHTASRQTFMRGSETNTISNRAWPATDYDRR